MITSLSTELELYGTIAKFDQVNKSHEFKEYNQNTITKTQIILFNSSIFLDFENQAQIHVKKSTGKVPKANKIMIRPQFMKDHDAKAANCMDCVNPHGRKKLKDHTINGAIKFFFLE
ncbi:MAG: hypothetical protein ACOZBL_01110 [Patescibacteria group bacterium]